MYLDVKKCIKFSLSNLECHNDSFIGRDSECKQQHLAAQLQGVSQLLKQSDWAQIQDFK